MRCFALRVATIVPTVVVSDVVLFVRVRERSDVVSTGAVRGRIRELARLPEMSKLDPQLFSQQFCERSDWGAPVNP